MVIGEVNEGFFGEVALMTGGLRTATIMADANAGFKIYKDGIDYLSGFIRILPVLCKDLCPYQAPILDWNRRMRNSDN